MTNKQKSILSDKEIEEIGYKIAGRYDNDETLLIIGITESAIIEKLEKEIDNINYHDRRSIMYKRNKELFDKLLKSLFQER